MVKWRFLVGMLLSPLFAAAFYMILVDAQSYAFGFPLRPIMDLAIDVLSVSFFTYPIGWLVGILSYFTYQWLKLNSLTSYLIGGLIGGSLFAAWFVTPFPRLPEIWLPMVASASASCTFFWFVAIRRVDASSRIDLTNE
jgi:hypothetical protein